MAENARERIALYYGSLSKGQKKIADYISENYERASFMTAAELGKEIGVSESTVVRFASRIGFDGYPALQKNLRETVKSLLTSVQRMDVTNANGDDDILENAFLQDIETIRQMKETISRDAFDGSVKAINSAEKIYILGVRSSAALASFAAYYLGYIYDVVLVNTSSSTDMFEQMIHISDRDVCIAFSFPRYSTRTINALKFARSRGAGIISITDSELSPIAGYATHLLLAPSNMVSFVDSLAAPLSLVNALIAAASLERKDEAHKRFEELESLWEEYDVYSVTGEDKQ